MDRRDPLTSPTRPTAPRGRPRARRFYGGLLLCAAVSVILAGCGTSSPDASPTTSRPGGDEPASGTPDPSPTTERPSPADVPPAPTVPEAADGTDLAACEDGRCEVRVTAGESVPLPQAPVRLEALSADEYTFVFEPSAAGGSIACNQRCSMRSGLGQGPTTVTGTGGSTDAYGSRLTVVAHDAEALVLHVAPVP
ncbi:hypothetical protein [Streptomyces sp. NPDC127098]|uniref:hypothetical protein n=1 Tax=Streptomyces sp. NPDC127098 TaxID=3347137 RepID=UPI003657DDE3